MSQKKNSNDEVKAEEKKTEEKTEELAVWTDSNEKVLKELKQKKRDAKLAKFNSKKKKYAVIGGAILGSVTFGVILDRLLNKNDDNDYEYDPDENVPYVDDPVTEAQTDQVEDSTTESEENEQEET